MIDVAESAHGIWTQPVARVELVGRERRIGGAEVDLARRDRGDARARAHRAVGDLRAGLRRVVGRPERDERRDERCSPPR